MLAKSEDELMRMRRHFVYRRVRQGGQGWLLTDCEYKTLCSAAHVYFFGFVSVLQRQDSPRSTLFRGNFCSFVAFQALVTLDFTMPSHPSHCTR